MGAETTIFPYGIILYTHHGQHTFIYMFFILPTVPIAFSNRYMHKWAQRNSLGLIKTKSDSIFLTKEDNKFKRYDIRSSHSRPC